MTPVRLAVFDCDGTLVDSQANIVRAMAESFARCGLPEPDPHATRRVVGLSLVEAMRGLLPDADDALHHRLADDYRHAFQRLRSRGRLDPEPLFDGVHDLLHDLHAEGWLLAVATGKSDRGLAFCLDHHGIAALFTSLQTADRHPSKPHPAMLLAALAECGATPADAVMIGDTVFDIGLGVNAGVRALGVDWGYHHRDELTEAGAAGVAATAAELRALLG